MATRTRRAGTVVATAVAVALGVVPAALPAHAGTTPCSAVDVTAHRGFGNDQNTLPAFDRAVRRGADVVETDLRRTVDGVVVLRHDDGLATTTNGDGTVSHRTWAYVRHLQTEHGYRVPTIGRLVRTMAARAAVERPDLQLELKVTFSATEVRRLVATLRRFGYADRVVLTAPRLTQLDVVDRVAPAVTTGFLVFDPARRPDLRVLHRHHVDYAMVGAAASSARFVRSAARLGVRVSARDMSLETAARRHVDRVLTDVPLGCPVTRW
jgi:glycerophosphoryl diester phosphodiesterase